MYYGYLFIEVLVMLDIEFYYKEYSIVENYLNYYELN